MLHGRSRVVAVCAFTCGYVLGENSCSELLFVVTGWLPSRKTEKWGKQSQIKYFIAWNATYKERKLYCMCYKNRKLTEIRSVNSSIKINICLVIFFSAPFVCVFVIICWILFGRFRMSDFGFAFGLRGKRRYKLHYMSSYEWNLVTRIFVKQGLILADIMSGRIRITSDVYWLCWLRMHHHISESGQLNAACRNSLWTYCCLQGFRVLILVLLKRFSLLQLRNNLWVCRLTTYRRFIELLDRVTPIARLLPAQDSTTQNENAGTDLFLECDSNSRSKSSSIPRLYTS